MDRPHDGLCISEWGRRGDYAMSLQTEVGRPQFNLQLLGARLPDSDDQTRKGGGRRGQTGVAQQRILLVEDDRGIRNVLGTILEEHGYVVTAVGNGRQALHLSLIHISEPTRLLSISYA